MIRPLSPTIESASRACCCSTSVPSPNATSWFRSIWVPAPPKSRSFPSGRRSLPGTKPSDVQTTPAIVSVPPVGDAVRVVSPVITLLAPTSLDRPRGLDGRERVAEQGQRAAGDRADRVEACDAGDLHGLAEEAERLVHEPEEVGAAAEDVVLAETAEHDVAAAATLDVVLTVGRSLERGDDVEVADVVADLPAAHGQQAAVRRARRADVREGGERALDPAVALGDVVAHLTEQQIVSLAPGEVVVAEAAAALRLLVRRQVGVQRLVDRELDVEAVELMARVLVVEVDEVLRPPRVRVEAGAVRIAVRLPDAVHEEQAAVVLRDGVAEAAGVRAIGAAVEQRPAERLEAPVRRVDRPGVIGRRRERRLGDPPEQEDVVAEDHVVALVAVRHVVAGAADEDVAAEVAEEDVVGTVLEGARVDQPDRRDRRGLNLLQALVGLVRVRGLLHDDAVVAEDHVVEQDLQPAEGG